MVKTNRTTPSQERTLEVTFDSLATHTRNSAIPLHSPSKMCCESPTASHPPGVTTWFWSCLLSCDFLKGSLIVLPPYLLTPRPVYSRTPSVLICTMWASEHRPLPNSDSTLTPEHGDLPSVLQSATTHLGAFAFPSVWKVPLLHPQGHGSLFKCHFLKERKINIFFFLAMGVCVQEREKERGPPTHHWTCGNTAVPSPPLSSCNFRHTHMPSMFLKLPGLEVEV